MKKKLHNAYLFHRENCLRRVSRPDFRVPCFRFPLFSLLVVDLLHYRLWIFYRRPTSHAGLDHWESGRENPNTATPGACKLFSIFRIRPCVMRWARLWLHTGTLINDQHSHQRPALLLRYLRRPSYQNPIRVSTRYISSWILSATVFSQLFTPFVLGEMEDWITQDDVNTVLPTSQIDSHNTIK